MDIKQYLEYEKACRAELEVKQEKIAETILNFTNEIDFDHGIIRYLDNDELFMEASVLFIGSRGMQSNTWMWAWANQTLNSARRDEAVVLKEIYDRTGQEEFQSEKSFSADEEKAWNLTAVACEHLGGIGAYRQQSENSHYFFVIRKLKHFKSKEIFLKRAQTVIEDYLKDRGQETQQVDADDVRAMAQFELRSLIISEEVQKINLLRKRYPEIRIYSQGADLRGKLMPYAYDLHIQKMFDEGYYSSRRIRNLSGVNLSMSRLDEVIMSGMIIREASFDSSSLTGADLSGADLRNASFRNAFLNGVNFTRAKLAGADFTGAELSRTLLTDVDLSEIKGLDEVNHLSHSEISLSTLIASHFDITPAFLRKAGVSRGLIEDLMKGKRFSDTYQTCFLSYSSKDKVFAEQLYNSLIKAEVRVFWDHFDLIPGERLDDQIREAINEHDRLLVILSANSMSSNWVKREIELAWYHKRDSLVPIRLCPIEEVRQWTEEQKELPKLADEFPVLDFSEWKILDKYDHTFTLLLKSFSGGVDFRLRKDT